MAGDQLARRFGPFGRTLRTTEIEAAAASRYNAWIFGGWGWRFALRRDEHGHRRPISSPDHADDDEPDHDELCRREQDVFRGAVRGEINLDAHWQAAADSLRVVLAADQSAREGRTITL